MMQSSRSAFTLVEILVALFIVSVALSGAFAVISFNVQSANFVKNSFIASGLAQEGVELVRNLRDTDWHQGNAFGAFGEASGFKSDGVYRVQWDSQELLDDTPEEVLRLDSTGLYAYTAGVPTKFRRTIQLQRVVPATGPVAEIVITVRVIWAERSGDKEVVAEEHLFNWYQ